jgi:hypothetical protein
MIYTGMVSLNPYGKIAVAEPEADVHAGKARQSWASLNSTPAAWLVQWAEQHWKEPAAQSDKYSELGII